MQLIGSLTSPFVRKIRVQLLEKGLPFSFVEETPWSPTTRVPEYNPLGKVPVLIDEQGQCWYDSPVIAEYIETLETRTRLIPLKSRAAVEVRQLEALADGLCDAGVAIFLERKRPAEQQSPEWITRQLGKLKAGLAALEKVAQGAADAGREWLHESGFSIADITAGAVVDWLDFRMPELQVESGHPHLAALVKKLNSRDSFKETIPVG